LESIACANKTVDNSQCYQQLGMATGNSNWERQDSGRTTQSRRGFDNFSFGAQVNTKWESYYFIISLLEVGGKTTS